MPLHNTIFQLISWIDTLRATRKIVVRWMQQNSTDDEWTLVQVIAWCCQATSHCRSQCWPRSVSPYGVTRPKWVNAKFWNRNMTHVLCVSCNQKRNIPGTYIMLRFICREILPTERLILYFSWTRYEWWSGTFLIGSAFAQHVFKWIIEATAT